MAPKVAPRHVGFGVVLAGNPITQAIVKLDPGVRLYVTWVVYRAGRGTVTFDPIRVPVVSAEPPGSVAAAEPLAGKATTKVAFTRRGTYLLRAYADDGVLVAPLNVTVIVQPAAKPQFPMRIAGHPDFSRHPCRHIWTSSVDRRCA
jgi:hypothetical protein